MNIQNYIDDRVEDQLKYYSRKGGQNKKYYLGLKISQLIAAALLPFVSVFISVEHDWAKYVVAFLGTLVTILEGVLAVGKYHEKWIMYRSAGEALKQEKFLFLMQAGNYTGADAAMQFVNRIELILGKENSGWQQMIVKEKEAEEKPSDKEDAAPAPVNQQVANKNDEPAAENIDSSEPQILDPLIGVNVDTEAVNETRTALRENEAGVNSKDL
jgi:hypothetical protein